MRVIKFPTDNRLVAQAEAIAESVILLDDELAEMRRQARLGIAKSGIWKRYVQMIDTKEIHMKALKDLEKKKMGRRAKQKLAILLYVVTNHQA